ncbi:GNAT family N-acetyltransferase [Pseudoduganella flava]|uniref:GNAT family N-acetyltransferase n=1 Tax=Pseudoduganella flava TaxID=871742 RepID=A0ABX6FZW6_9BURK|nr:GNAT family N-acetyltransferase [Pseudoduganella flava]
MAIVRANAASVAALAHCDFSFEIASELTAPFDDECVARATPLAAPYRKRYDVDFDEIGSTLDDADCAVFVAQAAGHAVGYLIVGRCWSGYAIVEDFAVDAAHRGLGLARQLMDAAVGWAQAHGMPGLRLETQSNNVAACRFYRRYGFTLGGHDHHLYRALHPGTREVALYWYLPFALKER